LQVFGELPGLTDRMIVSALLPKNSRLLEGDFLVCPK
jgi:hypothetical protein